MQVHELGRTGAHRADGQWVVNGVVQTADPAAQAHATHVADLNAALGGAAATTAVVNAGGAAPAAGTAGAGVTVINSGLTRSNPNAKTLASTGQKSGEVAKTSKIYKASGGGEKPSAVSAGTDYGTGSQSGSVFVNNWANFSIDFNGIGTPQKLNDNDGSDFFVDSGDSQLICSYLPLDKYLAGNTSLDLFITSYMAYHKAFRGGSLSSATLGAYNYRMVTKAVEVPYGIENDFAYFRVVDGTNYAQIITVEKHGGTESFARALNTISRVR